MTAPTERDIYFFDLRGYLHLGRALSSQEVAELNAALDAIPRRETGDWHGHIHFVNYGTADGLNLQQICEAGEPFEQLIDHPSWIDKVKFFVGGEGTFDYKHGPLFIDENFANFRGPGEAIGLHSGGHERTKRTQFRYHDGRFHCGQINILMALTDIGPGDGATMLIPGSHKANFIHPDDAQHHMKQGERRIVVYRYGPSWGRSRHGYEPSRELLDRLTPQRRQIIHPQETLSPPAEV